MNILKYFGVIIVTCVTVALLGLAGVGRGPWDKPAAQPQKPSIDTIIRSSISSIKAQNELLVMTSQLNSQATSKMSSMGMTGQRTDVVSADVQYRVSLSNLDAKMIQVTGDQIKVTIPGRNLQVSRLPFSSHESYDNGSWLFSFSDDAQRTLERENMVQVIKSLDQQAQELKGQARTNAQQSIKALFDFALAGAGVNKVVSVEITG